MGAKNESKNEDFEKLRYLSDECIFKEDFSSIKFFKYVLEWLKRCGSVLRAFAGKQG